MSNQVGEDMKSTREPKAALSNKKSNPYIEARQSITFSRYDTPLTIGKDWFNDMTGHELRYSGKVLYLGFRTIAKFEEIKYSLCIEVKVLGQSSRRNKR